MEKKGHQDRYLRECWEGLCHADSQFFSFLTPLPSQSYFINCQISLRWAPKIWLVIQSPPLHWYPLSVGGPCFPHDLSDSAVPDYFMLSFFLLLQNIPSTYTSLFLNSLLRETGRIRLVHPRGLSKYTP